MHKPTNRPPMPLKSILVLAAASVAALCATASALEPADLFVVYNRNVPESREIAQYYMQQRNVPAAHCIGLDLPQTDEISREDYLAKIRRPLRGWFARQDLQDKIKCLVTVYGVPLRVGRPAAQPGDDALIAEVQRAIDAATADLDKLAETMAGAAPASQPATVPAKPDVERLFARYQDLRNQAIQRLQAATDPQQQQQIMRSLQQSIQQVEGMAAILGQLQPQGEGGKQVIQALRAQAAEHRRLIDQGLGDCPRGDQRGKTHDLIRQALGLRGLIEHLQQDLATLQGKDTRASVDSELALLWWDDYPLYRWVWNPLCWRVRYSDDFPDVLSAEQMDRPVVMVARLDGPTPQIVRRMIDDAIATERTGLAGTFYVDARGMTGGNSGYPEYDNNLRDLAGLLEKTGVPVVLDNNDALFAVDACPDAALYCGWYKLANYVDSFEWQRGAVAYHIASSEAVSLRRPGAQYWCKRMLEEGVAATLGPVAEPYLVAFPRPHDFFGLLLTGRYTLAEAYAYTNHFNSWMMVLLGDPLYNPFAARPRMKVQDVIPAAWIARGAASQPAAPPVAAQ